MHSRSHETRTAASVALSQICSLAPLWEPPDNGDEKDDSTYATPPEFPNFSVKQLMESKTRLLASSGKEYARPIGIFQNAAEVKKARKAAMGRLGLDFLDVADDDEMDLDKELAAADDLDIDSEIKIDRASPPDDEWKVDSPVDPKKQSSPSGGQRASLTPAPSEDDLAGLSARERNRLKRKRKPGNNAFVAAPPPQASNSKYSAAAGASSSKYVWECTGDPRRVILTQISFLAELVWLLTGIPNPA